MGTMTGRTHDLAAITALGAVYLVLTPTQTLTLATVLVAILANQIGGIAPDIDQPTAPFWRNLPIGGPIGRAFDKLLGGHRFLTHSLLGVILFGLLTHWLLQLLHPIMPTIDSQVVWIAFMIGLISHLVMDMFTKEGVPWLLPVPIKFGLPPFRQLRITTGKASETFVVLPGLIGINFLLYSTHYNQVITLLHYSIK
jgi:inner membrane protein